MLRLVHFYAKDYRSIAELELRDLPPVVLLYGDNDAGKTNVLSAIDTWFRLVRLMAGVGPFHHDKPMNLYTGAPSPKPDVLTAILDPPAQRVLRATGRSTVPALELSGTIRLEEAAEGAVAADFTFRFSLSTFRAENQSVQPRADILTAMVPGADRLDTNVRWMLSEREPRMQEALWHDLRDRALQPRSLTAPLPGSDNAVIELRRALTRAAFRIDASRSLVPEERLRSSAGPPDDEIVIDPLEVLARDGSNLRTRLFHAATSLDSQDYQAFHNHLPELLQSPVRPVERLRALLEPEAGNKVHLLLGDYLVEDRGSAVRQWTIIAGLLALAQPSVLLIEEPEAHFSWDAQRRLGDFFRQLAETPAPPHQIIASTHSYILSRASSDGVYFKVERDESGATIVTRRDDVGELAQERDRASVTDRTGEIAGANLLALPPRVLQALGNPGTGDRVGFDVQADGTVVLLGSGALAARISEELRRRRNEPG